MDVDKDSTPSFFTQLRTATASEHWRIGQGLDSYHNPQMSRAERTRFDQLMEFIAYEAIKKVFAEMPEAERSRRWTSILDTRCHEAFNAAVKKNLARLFKAKEVKFSIRDVQLRANAIIAQSKELAAAERSKMIKETREALARDLRQTRGRLTSLKMKAAMYERRMAAMRETMEPREFLAEQLVRARARLDILRHTCVKEEAAAAVRHNGMLPAQITATLYPAPPAAHLAPTDYGQGLPEESGIYFFWRAGVVDYVGQSINLRNRVRLKGHHVLQEDHGISFVLIDRRDLDWAECWYIGALRPQCNFGKRAHHAVEKESST